MSRHLRWVCALGLAALPWAGCSDEGKLPFSDRTLLEGPGGSTDEPRPSTRRGNGGSNAGDSCLELADELLGGEECGYCMTRGCCSELQATRSCIESSGCNLDLFTEELLRCADRNCPDLCY